MGREEKLLELVERGINTVKDLSRELGVSVMTVYRTINRLEERGIVYKKQGKVFLKDEPKTCRVCGKTLDGRNDFIIRRGKRSITACCPHCGLILLMEEGEASLILAKDFITGKPVNGVSAFYVVGSKATPCCAPSAIVFENKEDAYRFYRGFGGRLCTFKEAMDCLKESLKVNKVVWTSLK